MRSASILMGALFLVTLAACVGPGMAGSRVKDITIELMLEVALGAAE